MDVNNFYQKEAYFLATIGITQFKNCSQKNKIINEVINLTFDEDKSQRIRLDNAILEIDNAI